MNKIHELATQGKSIQDIAIELGIARNTVRKYLRHPELVAMPHPRPNRHSKLDPFKEQVKQWINEDHCYNCEAMLPRLLAMGYKGSLSLLKAFVHPLRPKGGGHYAVIRYETKPAEQVQFDWGEFKYEHEGGIKKLYGFSAILCYSRMRFATFVKRCDVPTLIRCVMEAFEYFGGLPKAGLTDRMKSVLLEMEGKVPRWNPRTALFMASIGVAPRVCKAFTPQTKGKIERTIGKVSHSFWPGVSESSIDDLNRQAHAWCERIHARVHRPTHERPSDRRKQEPLAPLPQAFAWERFATEERRVGWDGYLSYDGVLYGLPADPPLAGSVVQVRERHAVLSVWSAGQLVAQYTKRPQSQVTVTHPDQFRTVVPAAARRAAVVPPFASTTSAADHEARSDRVRPLVRGGGAPMHPLKQLGLTQLEQARPSLYETARQEHWTYETFFSRAIAAEIEGRDRRAAERRMTAARLPALKTLEAFDFSFQPTLSERLLWELADLSFLRTTTNVVFLGPPGVGKTHLSLALTVKALSAGYSALFTTLTHPSRALESASYPGLMRQRLRRYTTRSRLVIDEVGYTKLSPAQAHHFFELVTARDVHGSIVLTSNTSFSDWGSLLGDEVLATALLDRLLHHAEVISINGPSYRMKDRRERREAGGQK